jgi:hypothetical protein
MLDPSLKILPGRFHVVPILPMQKKHKAQVAISMQCTALCRGKENWVVLGIPQE